MTIYGLIIFIPDVYKLVQLNIKFMLTRKIVVWLFILLLFSSLVTVYTTVTFYEIVILTK